MKRPLFSRLLVWLGCAAHRWDYRGPHDRRCLDCDLHQVVHRGRWENMNLVRVGPPCRRPLPEIQAPAGRPRVSDASAWPTLTDDERMMMREALGLYVDGSAPTRNYFPVLPDSPDCQVWRGLVRRGLAVESELNEGQLPAYFHVSEVGKRAVGLPLPLSPELEEELRRGALLMDSIYVMPDGEPLHASIDDIWALLDLARNERDISRAEAERLREQVNEQKGRGHD